MIKKTALVLSGGGSRGGYEIGVWKALRELGVKIDMVTGTSVGAINGAMIAQGDPALSEALWRQLETDMVFDVNTGGIPAEDALAYAREIILHGGAGSSGLEKMLKQYVKEEQVRSSGLEYGLVTTEFPSMEGRFLFIEDIPSGQLTSYLLASASCFPALRKCVIGDKKFIDGGYRDNLPVDMAMERGASSIIAVDLQAAGLVRWDTIKRAEERMEEFRLLKSALDLGNFLIFDRTNTSRIIQLGYLETMRQWGKYDGSRYTFATGVFSPHQLSGADSAAFLLKLDPCRVYDRETLRSAAAERLQNIGTAAEEIRLQKLPELLKASRNTPGLRTQLLLFVAESLRKEKENSPFLQPSLFRLLEGEIQAANFLINEKVL